MTTPKKYQSERAKQAREQAARIKATADERAAELQKLIEMQEAATKAVTEAEQHEAQVLAYANAQGLPPEIAEKELDQRSGSEPADAMQMTPQQYAAHRSRMGLY